MKACKHPAASRGFTLMEILIALLIFGIIVTTVFASHRSVFMSAPIIENSVDLYAMSDACLERIALDLRSACIVQLPVYGKPQFNASPDPYRVVGYDGNNGGKDGQRLRFASYAHLPLEQSVREGVAELVYYERTRGEASFDLMRSDSLYPYPEFEADGRDPVLCAGLKRLEITYFDQEGTDHTYWDSESDEFDYATPGAVEILIEMSRGETGAVFETRVAMPVVRRGIEE